MPHSTSPRDELRSACSRFWRNAASAEKMLKHFSQKEIALAQS
jgi:hypothetical protein